jgi:hypothetical protein
MSDQVTIHISQVSPETCPHLIQNFLMGVNTKKPAQATLP